MKLYIKNNQYDICLVFILKEELYIKYMYFN